MKPTHLEKINESEESVEASAAINDSEVKDKPLSPSLKR